MSRQVVGIDLGTSNTAIARFVPRGNALEMVPITQRISPTEVGERFLLPSFLYLPGEYELPAESTSLPWDAERKYLVGEFARFQGARVPGRCVVSAKSWLAHRKVDPTEPVLPWDRASDLKPVSAVAAITRYLAGTHSTPVLPQGGELDVRVFTEMVSQTATVIGAMGTAVFPDAGLDPDITEIVQQD